MAIFSRSGDVRFPRLRGLIWMCYLRRAGVWGYEQTNQLSAIVPEAETIMMDSENIVETTLNRVIVDNTRIG